MENGPDSQPRSSKGNKKKISTRKMEKGRKKQDARNNKVSGKVSLRNSPLFFFLPFLGLSSMFKKGKATAKNSNKT